MKYTGNLLPTLNFFFVFLVKLKSPTYSSSSSTKAYCFVTFTTVPYVNIPISSIYHKRN